MRSRRGRSPYAVYNSAALAPLRRTPAHREPMPLKLNARRRYALERCDKFKWYPRAGWRFESAAVNALVRDFVSAQWVTEKVTDKGTRTLVLSDIGQKILGGGDDSEQGTVERPAVD